MSDDQQLSISVSEVADDAIEQRIATFRTSRKNLGTRTIMFSEKTLIDVLPGSWTSEHYHKALNWTFLVYFVLWIVSRSIDSLYLLGFAAAAVLFLADVMIVLNLRFTLLQHQFESVEFSYLIFSAILTFVVSSDSREWDPAVTSITAIYYITFCAIICFDCLEEKLRSTSKFVLLVGGISFAINAMMLEFLSQDELEEQGFVFKQWKPLSKDADTWTNIELYIRLNAIQSFFCFKFAFHLFYHPEYSYFITERRENKYYDTFSLTYRGYTDFVERKDKHAVQLKTIGRTPRPNVRFSVPEVPKEIPDEPVSPTSPEKESPHTPEGDEKTPTSSSPLHQKKLSWETAEPLDISVASPEHDSGKADTQKRMIQENSKDLSRIWAEEIQTMEPNAHEAEMSTKFVSFDPTLKDTIKSNQSDVYGAWIPREKLVKIFNFVGVTMAILHPLNLVFYNPSLRILIDLCIFTMGLICLVNIKFEYWAGLVQYDLEYWYLMFSCGAAWFFYSDIYAWNPVQCFRGLLTWTAIACFVHFDLLFNELKRTLKFGLMFMVFSFWLLMAYVNVQTQEELEESFHIREWNISETDHSTNLEWFLRIAGIMSLFWVKLAYHLHFYKKYFYFNRVMIKLEDLQPPTYSVSKTFTPSTSLDVPVILESPSSMTRYSLNVPLK